MDSAPARSAAAPGQPMPTAPARAEMPAPKPTPAAMPAKAEALESEREIPEESAEARAWQQQVVALGLKGIANEVLLNSVLLRADATGLQVALDSRLKSLYRPALLQQLSEALARGQGDDFKVDLQTTEDLDRDSSPAACIQRDQARHRQQLLRQIRQQPLVQALQQHFQAEVLEQSLEISDIATNDDEET